jgi:CRISPR-associated endonuclease/helicase Cas3
VLPFLSIVDQNSQVIQKALGLENGTQTNIMVTHHHLSSLQYDDIDIQKESYSGAESALLIEGWHSEVIVTTFVQFLETIIGASASSLRKLHNIAGSIIILDEVQSIDYKHWLLVHDSLKFWAEEFETRIIFMTATQPLIFDRKSKEIVELCNLEQRGLYKERVHLRLDLEAVCIDKFNEKINKLIHEIDGVSKSFLIITNTIRSAISVFESINGHDDEKFYLSAEVLPVERQERIKAISNRLDKRQRTILISTQVVEAGVDFDFDIVIRDLAPIDSTIQAAGRCNRHGLRSKEDSPVYIFNVHDEKNNSFAPKIYGNYLIEKTRQTFSEAQSNCEGELRLSELVDIYYHKVKEGGSKQASIDVLKEMKKLNYDDLDFKVIEDEPNLSIFLEINKEAEDVWQEYQVIAKMMDVKEKGKRLKSFFHAKRHIFYNYVISSYPDIVKALGIPFEKPFFYVEKSVLSKYYGITGLRRS